MQKGTEIGIRIGEKMKKRRINKRVYTLALAALLSASAVSCGNTYSNQNETKSNVAETTSAGEANGVMSTAGVQRDAVQVGNQETETTIEKNKGVTAPSVQNETEGGEAQPEENTQVENLEETVPEQSGLFQAISKVEDYINVRNAPSTEGEVVGKIENAAVVTVLEEAGDWYQIKTDTVQGYCKAEFFLTELTGVENLIQPTVTTAVCNATDYVNIRSTPSTDGDVVGIVYEGNAVTILEAKDGWYHIKSGSVEGYSKAEYFTMASAVQSENSAQSVIETAICKASDYVNLRYTPSTDGDVLGIVYEGSVVTVLEEVDDWYRIKSDSKEGYVKAEFFEKQGIMSGTARAEEPVQTNEPTPLSETEQPSESESVQDTTQPTESVSEENLVQPAEEVPTETEESVQTPEGQETSIFDTIAVSRVSDYVNVRSEPSTEGEILGKIYDGCAATILEVVDDWYRIESGSVKGYIKAEFFVTGAEAEALAAELATEFGVVNTTILRVRAEASLESDCIDMVAGGSEFVVEEEKDGWGKIELDNTTKGWVSLEFLDTRIEFDTAISIEEERAKLEEQRLAAERAEEARRRAEAAAAAANAARNQAPASNPTPSPSPSTAPDPAPASEPAQSAEAVSEASSSLREAIVTYALQFVGNPYVYGGNSLTHGTDCSGFVKLIYAEFGYSLERRASYQFKYNGTQISVDQLRPGDLVFYGSGEVEHVAMFIGNGQIVHASTSRTGIIIGNLYYRTPYGAVRIIND